MSDEQLALLREWIRAEINHAISSDKEDNDCYFQSAPKKLEYANKCYEDIKAIFTNQQQKVTT